MTRTLLYCGKRLAQNDDRQAGPRFGEPTDTERAGGAL